MEGSEDVHVVGPDVANGRSGAGDEASLDVHALISLAAHALARKHWRASGARNEAEARSWWAARCRRRVGVAVARAYARYRLRRLVFIGVPRAALDDRRRRDAAALRRAAMAALAQRTTS